MWKHRVAKNRCPAGLCLSQECFVFSDSADDHHCWGCERQRAAVRSAEAVHLHRSRGESSLFTARVSFACSPCCASNQRLHTFMILVRNTNKRASPPHRSCRSERLSGMCRRRTTTSASTRSARTRSWVAASGRSTSTWTPSTPPEPASSRSNRCGGISFSLHPRSVAKFCRNRTVGSYTMHSDKTCEAPMTN